MENNNSNNNKRFDLEKPVIFPSTSYLAIYFYNKIQTFLKVLKKILVHSELRFKDREEIVPKAFLLLSDSVTLQIH